MLITKIPAQLSHALASARLSIQSILDALRDGMDLILTGNSMGSERPALALIPVRQHGNTCGHAIPVNTDTCAHAAVRMYADPVTKEWRVLNFGKTTTGPTGHFQPSRFAP